MTKKCYRFFGGFLQAQENWLNRMARQGYRLKSVHKMLYEFSACTPGEVGYKVEFTGQRSLRETQDYKDFLEELGCRVFYKNINLNYSLFKVKFRPWANRGGRWATPLSTYNRELLIVEKEADGKPFQLHTSWEDLAWYYSTIRNPWLTLAVLLAIFALTCSSWAFGALTLAACIPVASYQYQILSAKRQARTRE